MELKRYFMKKNDIVADGDRIEEGGCDIGAGRAMVS